ncbi:hypothetical protein [Streptomyces sp. NBC_00503]|uniref:hypothetical protein n=1 Tax=Streptomyces sp. NBC_00503 TaxID=2903659 RepID=UPI002E81CCE0|nr:hypothetical protein [Streptomyces sp. NBC_00503]WUD86427.1 hypothetical protein OG490_38095 [Streptomyces sp. NBC_00503]
MILSTRPFARKSEASRAERLETFERPVGHEPGQPHRSCGQGPDGAGCQDSDPAWRGL